MATPPMAPQEEGVATPPQPADSAEDTFATTGSANWFELVYEEERLQLLIERLRLALSVGASMYLLFGILDFLMAPEFARRFMTIRGLVFLLSGFVLAASFTKQGKRWMEMGSVVVLLAASTGISVMTTYLGGFASDYYIGNMLVLFFVGLFMPWRFLTALVFCTTLIGTYFGLNIAQFGVTQTMLSPAFFLLGAGAFSCVAVLASDRSRRRSLSLRMQIERANEELKKVDAAKTRFFANVSHELRTPLTLLFSPLEALLRSEPYGERANLYRSMQKNANRLLRQVEALLDLARLESGRLRLEPRERHARTDPARAGRRRATARRGARHHARGERARRPAEVHLRRREGRGDRRQPDLQRRQVHPRRRQDHRARGADRREDRLRGPGHRPRDPAEPGRQDLRALLPDRRLARRAPRRGPASAWPCRATSLDCTAATSR